ncbi:GNAT family N-acetyltransferase [Brevibacillus brevis]|uniref:GNAT family N-acetyltransferase n=1 Tax=Brevibacillus brevis TaxID=1393 RepID=UPI0011594B43|nr:GNAT family N-acetyltransferase [Lysinibacillus sp. SDF0063]TQR29805.1 N-acetyltransferase [Lysinibacillus sp. SDF0063]
MFIIRPYEKSDYPSIVAYDLPQEQAIYTSMPVDVIEATQNNPGYKPYVVFDQGHLIGFFALFTPHTGNPYTPNGEAVIFKSFSIDSRYQKKGYALRVFHELADIARVHYPERDEIVLTVHHTNSPAIQLYKKAGLVDQGWRFAGEFGEELIFHLDLTGYSSEKPLSGSV